MIDLTIRGGKYQSLAPYEITAATATTHPTVPASESNRETRAAIVTQLETAGFARCGGSYVSVEHAAQAAICVSGSGDGATIGIELWDEPRAAELLGLTAGRLADFMRADVAAERDMLLVTERE